MSRRRPSNVLEVRVSSPRLAWLNFVGFVASIIKIGFIVAVIAAIGWAGRQGYKRVVVDNPDFRLRVIDVNPNSVLDERGLVELTGLDLTSNITGIDAPGMRQTLLDHPAILDARIERHLPDTLVVRIVTREPRAWIAAPSAGITTGRESAALLIDANSVPYPCPELQLEEAATLPIIQLKADPAHPIVPGRPLRHDQLRQCLRLLDHAETHTPELIGHIDTLALPNAWSIRAVTRCGLEATFGLREQPRQLTRLRAALDHADRTGADLATINLIPRENIPITLKSGPQEPAVEFTTPPPRAIPVDESVGEEALRQTRQAADLDSLLNRH